MFGILGRIPGFSMPWLRLFSMPQFLYLLNGDSHFHFPINGYKMCSKSLWNTNINKYLYINIGRRVHPPIYGKNTQPMWSHQKSPQNRVLSILRSLPTWKAKCHWKLYSFIMWPRSEGRGHSSGLQITLPGFWTYVCIALKWCFSNYHAEGQSFFFPQISNLSKMDIFIKCSKNKFIEKLKILKADIQNRSLKVLLGSIDIKLFCQML